MKLDEMDFGSRRDAAGLVAVAVTDAIKVRGGDWPVQHLIDLLLRNR